MTTSRRMVLGGLAASAAGPAVAVDPRRQPKPEAPPPQPLPFSVTRGTPWTTVQIDGGEAHPFGLNLVNPHFHCHPSVLRRDYKGGQTEQEQFTLARVVVGGRLIDENVTCWSSPLAFEGLPVSGYVGLRRYDPFLLDWDARRLVIGAEPPEGWAVQRMIPTGAGPQIEATLDGMPLRLSLATYRPWGLQLSARIVKRHKLWDRYARRRNDLNADGAVLHQCAVTGSLQLGGLTFENLVTRLYRTETVYRYDQTEADGIIGFDLLRRMNLHLDRGLGASRNHKFAVSYSKQRNDPQADDRAGIVFKAFGSELQVALLDPGGPGAKAGLKVGDSLIDAEVEGSIEGLPYALTQPAGTVVPLDVQRGETRMRIVVTLEDRL